MWTGSDLYCCTRQKFLLCCCDTISLITKGIICPMRSRKHNFFNYVETFRPINNTRSSAPPDNISFVWQKKVQISQAAENILDRWQRWRTFVTSSWHHKNFAKQEIARSLQTMTKSLPYENKNVACSQRSDKFRNSTRERETDVAAFAPLSTFELRYFCYVTNTMCHLPRNNKISDMLGYFLSTVSGSPLSQMRK